MVFFLGCDVAADKLDMALIDGRGTALWHDVVANEARAIATFLLTLQGFYPDDDVSCVVESTGTMHLLFAELCCQFGLPCIVYNPILTKQQIKGSIRAKKTDKTDAVLIARIGLRGDGHLYTPDAYAHTRYATRAGRQLAKLGGAMTQFSTHIEQVLDTKISQDARDLLAGIQHQFALARAQFIRDTATHAPVGLMTLLQSIPGVGPYTAASLIGEIQDMTKFTSAKALIAYAGLDPRVRQSGKSLNSTGKLTKRGSPYLRRTAFISASVARRYDPQFVTYYQKKRDEGKSYKVATCAVARKLLATVRSVWLSNSPYKLPEQFITELGNTKKQHDKQVS